MDRIKKRPGRESGPDADGSLCRFVRYVLKGRVLGVAYG
jgi:hypothetical protein